MIHVAVALDGYGWNPQAWRYALSHNPSDEGPLSGRYWADVVATAERGLLDFVTFDDTWSPQPGRRAKVDPRRLAGRADAVLVAARVAPTTRHIGLVPVATVTHTEPFHVSKSIATLDYISHGRAGWQPRVSAMAHEAALFGRRDIGPADQLAEELFEEAADAVEVVRRLWDSWEDDAVIRDVSTGRFVDRDKLHYIDFTGRFFSVKGPSITPRPPQGRPVVAALAHAPRIYQFAATSADIVFITPHDDESLRTIKAQVDDAGGGDLKVYADLVVSFGGDADFRSDAHVFAGSATELAELIDRWNQLGVDGVRLRPAVNAIDLAGIVDGLVPLRERLGLAKAANRYTSAVSSSRKRSSVVSSSRKRSSVVSSSRKRSSAEVEE